VKNIWYIALIELKRMRRKQVVWFLCLVSVFLLFLMERFHYFTIEEQLKMIQDFALGLANLATLFLVVYYPVFQVKDEFTEKTIHSLLSAPVSRTTLLLGKALSMAFLLAAALLLNFCAVGLMLTLKGGGIHSQLIIAVVLIYLKNLTLVGFALLFGVTPLSGILCTVLTFLVYALGSVKSYFVETLRSGIPDTVGWIQKTVFTVVPNFRIYDVVENITLGRTVGWDHVVHAFVHFLGIAVLVYGAAAFFFNRREL
jgi:ABC-type transport system involved in multi-copper enzyme maturation permease subunit